jgi:hypothetical protein
MALTPKTVAYKSPYRVPSRRTSSFNNYGNYILGNSVPVSRMQRVNEVPQYYDDVEDPNNHGQVGTFGGGVEQPAMNGYKWVRNQRGERVQVRSNLTAKAGNWFDLVR